MDLGKRLRLPVLQVRGQFLVRAEARYELEADQPKDHGSPLRTGVKFQDGSAFSAEDVKFHYVRVKKSRREHYIVVDQYQFSSDMVIRDPYTLYVVTPVPEASFSMKCRRLGAAS